MSLASGHRKAGLTHYGRSPRVFRGNFPAAVLVVLHTGAPHCIPPSLLNEAGSSKSNDGETPDSEVARGNCASAEDWKRATEEAARRERGLRQLVHAEWRHPELSKEAG